MRRESALQVETASLYIMHQLMINAEALEVYLKIGTRVPIAIRANTAKTGCGQLPIC